jgi:long-subunit acyl-CoA synthetase (AMP-forming)
MAWVGGCEQVYTNIRKFKEDLGRYPPHHFVCVPLVLDTLFGRVRTQPLCPNTQSHCHARLRNKGCS